MVKRKAFYVFAFLLVGALFPATGFAGGYTLQLDGDTFATLAVRLQAAAVMDEKQAGAANGDATKGGTHYDAFARRVQLLASGQVTPVLSFMFMMEQSYYGKNYSPGTGLQTADAWVQWNMADSFHLLAGAFLPPFSRNQLTPTAYFIGVDRPIVDTLMLESPGMYEKRDRGLCLWGNLGGLQYRIAATKGGMSQTTGEEALRTTWRIHYAMLDPEPSYYYKESYLGSSRVFTIGYAVDKQDKVSLDPTGNPAPYSAWTADVLMEGGDAGSLLTLLYEYHSYRWGNNARTGTGGQYLQGDGWTLTAAYLGGNASQPYLRYTAWNAQNGTAGAKQKRTALGVNYLLKGHDAKITFEYEQTSFPNEGATYDLKNHGTWTLQFQTAF